MLDAPQPVQMLRAVLDDREVAAVLAAEGTSADAVRITLERRWLAGVVGPDDVTLHEPRVDLPALLRALSSGADLSGISGSARRILADAVRESAYLHDRRIAAPHVLLALLASNDPLLSATFAEHHLRPQGVRPHVGRRA